jgi:myo-inositol-1(or 4)-monophosphatase
LAEGNDIIAGVVVDPIHQKEFYACKGGGAFCNDKKLEFTKNENNIPVVFINHGHRRTDKIISAEIARRLAGRFNLRTFGTTALELCYVATGSFDGFICSGDEIWDFAAGTLIASEAGCLFTDWKGAPWDGKGKYVLVSKSEIHKELTDIIRDLQT